MGGRRLHVPALLLYTSPIPTNVQLAIYVAAKKSFPPREYSPTFYS